MKENTRRDMDTSKATPRPWVWDGPFPDETGANFWQIGTLDFEEVTTNAYSEENAVLIVRAVNAHAEMLSLLRRWNRISPAKVSPWPGISEETEVLLAKLDSGARQ